MNGITNAELRMVLPIPGKWEAAICPTQERCGNHFGVQPHHGRTFNISPELSADPPRVCQSPSLTLLCLEVDSMILGKTNRGELLLHSPDGLFTPPDPPSGLLAQASPTLFPVKLIMDQCHQKINNELITILHHLARLFSLCQRAASRGHLRPPSNVPSSLLPSPAPYISDLITCETQSRGLRCYPITKSRFI